MVLSCFLPYFHGLTTEMLSEDAISFLLADLNHEGGASPFGTVLGAAATEAFISERLLLLLPDAKEPFLSNLRGVLKHAGDRHGRRYGIA